MEIDTFKLNFGYAQIAVFNSELTNPFNSWRPQHYAQGFTWRPGSVSFRLLDEFGNLHIKVRSNNDIVLRPDTIRAILVPFSIFPPGIIEIASVDQGSRKIKFSEAKYALLFETGNTDSNTMWCQFSFILKETEVSPQILRADSGLSPTMPLVMEADPA